MNKPSNYDKVKAQGDFIPITPGGHILKIMQVEELTSRSGRPMIKVSFDFAQSDSQPGYFAKEYKNDIRPDKRWPARGATYMLTEDADGNCSRQLKTFITSVEKSNTGFSISWGGGFCDCLKGKLVGGVFGMVNDFYNGRPFQKTELRWFRSTDRIKDAEVPKEFETKAYREAMGTPMAATVTDAQGFMQIPDGLDEELPF